MSNSDEKLVQHSSDVIELHKLESAGATSETLLDTNVGLEAKEKKFTYGKGNHQCTVCNVSFTRMLLLRKHWNEEHQQNQNPDSSQPEDQDQPNSNHERKICSAVFKSQRTLKKHLNKHADAGKKSHPCTMCETAFTSREGRRVHMILKHNAGKTYKCEQCPMIFARMGNLRLHMTTHGVRPHVCSICGQSFARIDSLKNHEEACAEGKRGLFCEVCGQRFRKQELLDKHLQQGHPDKEFQCSHCGQGFETKRALSHHVRVHEGTFRCEHCPRQFVTERALSNHKKSRHWSILGIERVIGKQGRRKDAQPRQPKERVRRNKYCPFLGLEHLAELAEKKSDAEERPEGVGSEEAAGSDSDDSIEIKCDTVDYTSDSGTSDSTVLDAVGEIEVFQNMDENAMMNTQQSEEKLEKTERAESSCNTDAEDPKHTQNSNLSDVDDPNSAKKEKDTCEHHSNASDDQVHLSDRDQNQPSFSESDEVESSKLRTKRRSRKKQKSAEGKSTAKTPYPKKYKCDDCGKGFAHRTWWGAHRANAHGAHEDVQPSKSNRIHFCDECPKSFCDWRNLIYHLEHIHHKKIDSIQTVRCQSCKKNLLSEKDLKLHTCFVRKGFLNRPPEFKCDRCSKAYISKSALERHRAVHEEYHDISCELCQKPFAHEKDLSYHKKRVHVDASFVCEVCGKSFKVQNQLKTHINIHRKTKAYQCEYCGRAFAQRNGMTAHLRIAHAEQLGEQAMAEREITCSICEKKLKGKICYRLHMKTHTNERMYGCSHCDKRFVTNQDKLRHEQTHTKEYKFKCRFCDKGSTRRKLILLHEAKEHNEVSGEAIGPQHKCSYCGRCFSSPSAVAIHESLHSDALPVGCELCDRRFKNVKYMKYHLKAHHKQTTVEQKRSTGTKPAVDTSQVVAPEVGANGNELVYAVEQPVS